MPEYTMPPSREHIVARIKGLRDHLQPDEQPLFTIPGTWRTGREGRGTTCEIVLTDQRLLGYASTTFPRSKLFLESLTLSQLTAVSLRQQSYTLLFRELMVSDGRQRAYIRSGRQQIEQLYAFLRNTTERGAMATEIVEEGESEPSTQLAGETPRSKPVYGKQDIRVPFERSPLAITLLFVGGLALEIIGALLWASTRSGQIGLPLCAAGLIAVLTAIITSRRRD